MYEEMFYDRHMANTNCSEFKLKSYKVSIRAENTFKEEKWASLRRFGHWSLTSDPDNIWRRKSEKSILISFL